MNLERSMTAEDELKALVVSITRRNLTTPAEVRDALKTIHLAQEEEGQRVTYEEITSAFKILLAEAEDPKAPALIPLLVSREFLSA